MSELDRVKRDLLTVEQSADLLQLSQSSVRSYIREGKLKAFRIAGKRNLLIHRDDLLRLLEPAVQEIRVNPSDFGVVWGGVE